MKERNRRLYIVYIVVAYLLIASVFMVLDNREHIDSMPEEATGINFTQEANILGGEVLPQKLGSLDAYVELSEDLRTFAKKTIPEYKKDVKVIGFKVNSDIDSTDNIITFRGRFGAIEDIIDVKITKLKNKKIKLSVRNITKNIEVDSMLNSNSKRNQFIGILPYKTDNFTITYIETSDFFSISGSSSGAGTGAGVAYTLKALGLTDIKQDKIDVVVPPSLFKFSN